MVLIVPIVYNGCWFNTNLVRIGLYLRIANMLSSLALRRERDNDCLCASKSPAHEWLALDQCLHNILRARSATDHTSYYAIDHC
jgi:hypothetical protein